MCSFTKDKIKEKLMHSIPYYSSLIFILVPILCMKIVIPINIKIILGLIGLALMIKNAPADTYKRPIINKKRRLTYKINSIFIISYQCTCQSIV